MKNSLGTNVIFTLFGESHGKYIGATIDGLPAGIKIDETFIEKELAKRRSSLEIDTPRKEKDNYEFISGIFNGFTTGMPLTVLIKNEDVNSSSYDKAIIRPSHIDYVSEMKYEGYQDYRGGGHFSGRLTAPIVLLGSICQLILKNKGIDIATHILEIGDFKDEDIKTKKDLGLINEHHLPLISNKEKEVTDIILNAKNNGDSIGGVIQTGIIGLPLGIGEPWFSSLEGIISNAVFSIGGIKGIEFGKGFGFKDGFGSTLNDEYSFEEGKVITTTNNNGGINGGISNGMPIIFNMAVKPTPSISKEQNTVNLNTKENVKLNLKGRHDPAIIRRICPVITNLIAIVLCDELSKRNGTNYLK